MWKISFIFLQISNVRSTVKAVLRNQTIFVKKNFSEDEAAFPDKTEGN